MTEKAVDRLALVALALATAVFFWDALLMRGAFFVQDVMVQNYPFRDFFANAIKSFELPLWHPGINCGFPLFAEGQAGALYPLNLLLGLLFPTYVGLNLSAIVHTWLAAAGTYGFLRLLRCRPSAALTAALAYGFSGFLIVRAMSQNYQAVAAWFPFLFLLIELSLQRRQRWTWLALMAPVVGLQFLAGHPQATVYGLGAAILYGIVRGFSIGGGVRSFVIGLVVGVPVLGAGLAAVQLLPTWELVQLSGRGEGLTWGTFASMSLPPERLITLLLPDFYGNSSTGSYWGRADGFFIQLCPYIGILPVVLCFSSVRNRKDVPTGFFFGLCALALLLSLGKYTTLYRLMYEIPGLSFFRIPTRFLLWWALGGATLAGLGLDRILDRSSAASSDPELPSVVRTRSWTLTWIAVLIVWVSSMAWLNRQALEAGIATWLTHSRPAAIDALSRYSGDLAWDLVRLAAMALAAWILLAHVRKRRESPTGWAWVVPALVFVDLYSFGAAFNSLIPADVYTRVPASAQAILDRAPSRDGSPGGGSPESDDGAADTATTRIPPTGQFRCVSFVSERTSPFDWHSGWARDLTSYSLYPETLRMYSATLYGLANTLPGWSPLHLRSHWQFVGGFPGLLPIANARYWISHNTLQDNSLTIFHEGVVKVYEDPRSLPRAYFVPADTVIAAAAPRIAYMRGDGFDPGARVVLSDRPWQQGSGGVATSRPHRAQEPVQASRITHYDAESVRVELGPHDDGLLVLSDTHYPGWRAWVDGAEVPIAEANHVFRAVPVSAADREVLFRFEPASFRVGLWVSLLSAALTLWVLRTSSGRMVAVVQKVQPERENALGEHIRNWTLQLGLIVILHALVRLWPLWSQATARASMPAAWGGG